MGVVSVSYSFKKLNRICAFWCRSSFKTKIKRFTDVFSSLTLFNLHEYSFFS